jgi:DeoR family suf operon transcriptional repressor
MQSTRQAVLEALKERGRASINDLAEAVGVKRATVRHHLNSLQANGLVCVEEERQPVGRPRYIYSLTEAGQSRFPQKYHLLVERMLGQLKDTSSSEMVELFLRQLAAQVADEVRAELEQLPVEEQMTRLADVLSDEGFMAHWERAGDTIRLTEYHCPYYFVGQRHPEVCMIDETIIRIALGANVMKSTCLLHGDPTCTFEVVAAADEG